MNLAILILTKLLHFIISILVPYFFTKNGHLDPQITNLNAQLLKDDLFYPLIHYF